VFPLNIPKARHDILNLSQLVTIPYAL
jgi:hypothetical protein